MRVSKVNQTIKIGLVAWALAVGSAATTNVWAQTNAQVITLDPSDGGELGTQPESATGKQLAPLPPNFYRFDEARAGQTADLHKLTLRFARTAKINKIASTKDFRIEQGGSCVEERVYNARQTCTLLVRFTPQGPGNRLGHITIQNSASPKPASFGLTGVGYFPVVTFTPSVISTVAGTFPSGTGLLNGATNLAVDGGDTLYAADTLNNIVRYQDSDGAFQTLDLDLTATISGPAGIAVSGTGIVYFDQSDPPRLETYSASSSSSTEIDGTTQCDVGATCIVGFDEIPHPGGLAADPGGNVFLNSTQRANKLFPATSTNDTDYIPLADPMNYSQLLPEGPLPIGVDSSENIYSYYQFQSECLVTFEPYSDAVDPDVENRPSVVVAGNSGCGFSGDGGLGKSAKISTNVSQFAFDTAGNFYFTDTGNQRVRRIDNATGIINTIAGNGTVGYSGDGGAATNATLDHPTGLAIDSQGQVDIISGTNSGGTDQVIRQVSAVGLLSFANQLAGSSSAAKIVTVSNTGNENLDITNVVLTGANPGDFLIDPNTTSCHIASGSSLYGGHSCKIGVIFKPKSAGAREANLQLLDNTVTNTNTVLLSGSASLNTAKLTITSPASGTKVKKSAKVKFSVKVASSTSGPVPTGSVSLKVDSHVLGVRTLASGVASIDVSGLSVGTHWLAVSYSGNALYSPVSYISRQITVTK